MRPLYVTAADKKKEAEIAAFLSRRWKAVFKKLPDRLVIDWLVLRDGVTVAFAECKARTNAREEYPTYMLSLDKWMNGLAKAEVTGSPFFVVVEWTDGLYYHQAGTVEVLHGHGGRKDRNDPDDMEPVVYIPVSAFKRITTKQEEAAT